MKKKNEEKVREKNSKVRKSFDDIRKCGTDSAGTFWHILVSYSLYHQRKERCNKRFLILTVGCPTSLCRFASILAFLSTKELRSTGMMFRVEASASDVEFSFVINHLAEKSHPLSAAAFRSSYKMRLFESGTLLPIL